MRKDILVDEQRTLMLSHGARSVDGEDIDPPPVVKLFTPLGDCTWLLTELDPEDPDIAFGLCDLGMGFPNSVLCELSELAALRSDLGWVVVRDDHFAAQQALSAHAERAHTLGRIEG